jgi:acetolactate synthase I/II/III large subunit
MNVQELQALKTSGANIVVIVMANEGYLSIRQTHENFFGTVIGASPKSGVEVPDFAQLAAAYGIRSERISGKNDLQCFDGVMSDDGPAVIHVDVDPAQGFEPRIKSRMLPDGAFYTPELDDMFPFLPPEETKKVQDEASRIRAQRRV